MKKLFIFLAGVLITANVCSSHEPVYASGKDIASVFTAELEEQGEDKLQVTSKHVTNITQTSAKVWGYVEKPAEVVSGISVGIYLGESRETLVRAVTEEAVNGAYYMNDGLGFPIWYDVEEELGQTLTPGVTYYYQFYALYQGKEYKGEVQGFTTRPRPEDVILTVENKGCEIVSEEDVLLKGFIGKPKGVYDGITVGVCLGTDKDNLKTMVEEVPVNGAYWTYGGTGFDVWYDLKEELNLELKRGVTYYYQFYAIYDNREWRGEIGSFETDSRVMLGDIDDDKKVTLADAQLALKAALKMIPLTGNAWKAADTDENGEVTLQDVQKILKSALKLEVLS